MKRIRSIQLSKSNETINLLLIYGPSVSYKFVSVNTFLQPLKNIALIGLSGLRLQEYNVKGGKCRNFLAPKHLYIMSRFYIPTILLTGLHPMSRNCQGIVKEVQCNDAM